MSNTDLQTIDLDQLALVAGGAGPAENKGRQIGQQVGQGIANVTPAPLRKEAQKVLPPAGADVGGWIGHQIDNVTSHLPKIPGLSF